LDKKIPIEKRFVFFKDGIGEKKRDNNKNKYDRNQKRSEKER
jgi:hypothetical protein